MIHFAKLRLAGFKSFVDSTELMIEPGMTGVVGPNGCGKSNLVEALRWAMGETSAKQMRGGEMDDMIFGGTSHRPARNMAEVTICLDNSARQAPGLFNIADELEITRRIERGDGSSYRLNGKEVRARDVQVLFADLATGARSTAMVSQGRVGTLINAKPSQRRSLLEEAAGIGGLYTRRHEAENRLKAAEANLLRLEDVLAALDSQLTSLRRQVKQAQRYRLLSEGIRRAEAALLYRRWVRAVQALQDADSDSRRVLVDVAALEENASAAQRQAEAIAETLSPLREAAAAAGARLQRLRLAQEQLGAEERRVQDARVQLDQRLRQLAEDRLREQARSDDAGGTVERLRAELDDLAIAADGEEEIEAAAAERVAMLAAGVEGLDAEASGLTAQVAAREAERAALLRQIDEGRVRLERLRLRLQDLDDAEAALLAEDSDTEALAEAEMQQEQAAEAVEQARDTLERAEADQDAARRTLTQARDRQQQVSARHARLKAEVQGLAAAITGPAGKGETLPPVLDAMQVEAGYEQALGAALGEDLSAPAEGPAPRQWLEAGRRLDGLPDLPEEAEPLADYVQGPEALRRRLSQIGVVFSAERGQALLPTLKPGQRLVTPEGDLWRWDGFIQRAGAPSAAALRLQHRNRLQDLRGELELEAADLTEADAAVATAQEQSVEAENRLQRARAAVREADAALTAARKHHAEQVRRAAAQASRREALRSQRQAAEADHLAARSDHEAVLTAVERLEDQAGLRARAEEVRLRLTEQRQWLAEAQATLDRARRDSADRHRRREVILKDLADWDRRAVESASLLADFDRRQQTLEEERQDLEEQPLILEEQRFTLMAQEEAAAEAAQDSADRLAEAESAAREADRAAREAATAAAAAREARIRAEAQLDQGRQQVEQAATALTERLGVTPAEAHALAEAVPADGDGAPLPEALSELETLLARLTRDREAMGPVNLRAEQETAELDTQMASLVAERDDLVAAIGRLRQGINELNREGRQRLLASFEQVDVHFRRLFTRLFGGGRAHLALTESDDPLEAGLEIYASPPGKRLQILSLLSGGEQAMTALALLFAVFLVNPAPICVLDEVDAPLDDANVDRFCTMLDELTRSNVSGTRFLVVTHHRMTMARMDRLYGVTMQERGVSKLVSVDLREAEALREVG
ncbi:AAA family ATPase [Novispirillum itersonii]|uniref:Chromosome partition protein Smc n=1 Tax=Novispirillum itersonii TaxID=189 RepID=A0A7W9ZCT0_NOVIT|nr:AAA family ATPase [Novispirillum itersonii]MBB6209092.1 chromosome segregation protein [Novispirillum itersonii]